MPRQRRRQLPGGKLQVDHSPMAKFLLAILLRTCKQSILNAPILPHANTNPRPSTAAKSSSNFTALGMLRPLSYLA